MTAPYDCKHCSMLFILSERGPDAQRKAAYVCPECGTFFVRIDGEEMRFQLVNGEQVAAAGVYARRLAASENRS